jgi:thiamine biosynthesis protein ThiS
MSEISVNGQTRVLTSGTTVSDLVSSLTRRSEGCAVAVNDLVVPKSNWSVHTVEPGDRVEILTAVQGG